MSKAKIQFCSFLLFFIFFCKLFHFGIDPTVSGWFGNMCVILFVVLMAPDFKYLFAREYRWLNISLIAFGIISILSVELNISYMNSILVWGFDEEELTGVLSSKSITFASIGLLMMALFIERLADTKHVALCLRILLYCLGAFLVCVDIHAMQVQVINDSIDGYMVGTKFEVCYLNLYFCALYYMLHPKMTPLERNKLIFFIAILIIVSLHTECTTTLLGAAVFIFMVFFVKGKFKKIFARPLTFFIALIICDILFFFFTPWFLSFDFVQDFIVNVLHEDPTLTGRLEIYVNIQEAFNDSPWIGNGVGNSGVVSRMYTEVFDAQNGLVDLFIQVGITGCVAFLSILFLLVRQIRDRYQMVYPTIALLYTMLVISMVEIPFSHTFIFMIFFLLIKRRADLEDPASASAIPNSIKPQIR